MPVHPLHACLNHIVEQSIENILKATKNSNLKQIEIEAKHCDFVVKMLNELLLSRPIESQLEEYKDQIKPKYTQNSEKEYLKDMEGTWDFINYCVKL